jgi:hypothetical protein
MPMGHGRTTHSRIPHAEKLCGCGACSLLTTLYLMINEPFRMTSKLSSETSALGGDVAVGKTFTLTPRPYLHTEGTTALPE